ncbi:T9SS type A sorting domain-containing protein [Tamlana fucoidanivorans]|uniref:T9SS type A sorting domain-containing protein n=1 Tax=Allotamlana fucoidanivorans TaxID=2583814 RepID=A0A5C4SQF9_9FLAO|nr:T9SS type A sorting domain-containing protein [Tamlana fucoidanivorans]TNJ46495.1 T9SS type A sorting domain-containing protein [Tamlana fucoidanivorans]
MKKHYFLFLVLTSFLSFSQTVTWNNEDLNLSPGETISMDISYDVTPGDLNYLGVQLRELNSSWQVVNQYTFNTAVAGTEPNAQNNVIYNYTVDSGIPLTSELPSGNFYILMIFAEYDNGGPNYTNDNTVITIEETLSTEGYNKAKLNSFYSSVRDAIVMKDKFDGGFSIYNLTGQKVLEGEISNEISVSTLNTGLYFLVTEYGTLKFAK